jgi:hypothetical protein
LGIRAFLTKLAWKRDGSKSFESDRIETPKRRSALAELRLRKLVVSVEETRRLYDRRIEPPARKAVAAAVIHNPLAGRFVEDLTPLVELGAELGGLLARRAVEALGVEPGAVQSYGKGAIVGLDGEVEHAAALLHPRFGKPVREAVEKGDDIIPSTKVVGGPGTALAMPLTNKDNIWSFEHMDAAEVRLPDAPGPDEIVVAVVVSDGGRPLARITN